MQICVVRTILVFILLISAKISIAQMEVHNQLLFTPNGKAVLVHHFLFFEQMNAPVKYLDMVARISTFSSATAFSQPFKISDEQLRGKIFPYKNYWIAQDTTWLSESDIKSITSDILNPDLMVDYKNFVVVPTATPQAKAEKLGLITAQIFADRFVNNANELVNISCRANFFSEKNKEIYVQVSKNQWANNGAKNISVNITKEGKNKKSIQEIILPIASFELDTLLVLKIDSLRSGNYDVNINIVSNEILEQTQSIKIQKANSKAIDDISESNQPQLITLKEKDLSKTFVAAYPTRVLQRNAEALFPIATTLENAIIDQMVNSSNDSLLRNFFFNFWSTRNPSDPEGAWKKYAQNLNYVTKLYGGSGVPGYRTDRGRIYLKYGKPDISERVPNESGTLPYEIWQYNRTESHEDGVFLFASVSNFMGQLRLLHSTMPGEIFFPRWESVLINKEGGEHRIYEFLQKGGGGRKQ